VLYIFLTFLKPSVHFCHRGMGKGAQISINRLEQKARVRFSKIFSDREAFGYCGL